MDTFTLVVFLIMIMIAIQTKVYPIAVALIAFLLLTLKSRIMILIAIIAGIVGFFLNYAFNMEAQIILLLIVALIVGGAMFVSRSEGPGPYTPSAFGVI